MAKFNKLFLFSLFLILMGLIFAPKNQALAIANVSDTVSTSRPSASATLDADQAANATYVVVKDFAVPQINNSADWLASDSAFLFPDTNQAGVSAIVASSSANGIPAGNQKTIYFTSAIANTHHNGTTITTPVTAIHTIKFTAQAALSNRNKIQIVFPGTGTNSASPSATGFAFNNEIAQPTDVKCWDVTASANCTASATDFAMTQSNTYTITVDRVIATNDVVIINIGCTAINGSGICTTAAPRLVNPTKGSSATGTADNWKIQVGVQDSGGNPIETTKTVVATVESVQVQGIIEPYITFMIAGVNNGVQISTNNSGCTSNTESTNTGINALATFVNMGAMGAGISLAAQNLTVTTNGTGGYVLTATSSGHFINPATGFFFPDANLGNGLTANNTPVPAGVTAGQTTFGIHACGTDVATSGVTWGTGVTGSGINALYSNPWNTAANSFYATLASYPAGIPPSSRVTTVEYEATAATTVPAGTYTTALTYVATPAF